MRITTLFMLGTLLLIGCNGKSPDDSTARSGSNQMLMGEGISKSNGLSVTHGNVVVKEGKPGTAFATVTIPGQAKEIAYFLVFDHEFPIGSVSTQSSGDGTTAESSHTIESQDREFISKYQVELNPETDSIQSETISIAGSEFDPTQGKLFLVNLKKSPPTVVQVNLDMPTELPDLEKPESVERFTESSLDQFRKNDSSVDAFCQSIE